jgi:hyperosmotically inducible protein
MKKTYARLCMPGALLLIAALTACDRQSDPPEPRSAAPTADQPAASGGAPQADRTAGTAVDDAGLTARVKTALMADEQVKGMAIDVDTRNAQVTLTGTVDTEAQISRALEVARAVEGVQNVVNRLTVKGQGDAQDSNRG